MTTINHEIDAELAASAVRELTAAIKAVNEGYYGTAMLRMDGAGAYLHAMTAPFRYPPKT